MIYKFSWCLDEEGIHEAEEEDNDDDEGNEELEGDAFAIVAPSVIVSFPKYCCLNIVTRPIYIMAWDQYLGSKFLYN